MPKKPKRRKYIKKKTTRQKDEKKMEWIKYLRKNKTDISNLRER